MEEKEEKEKLYYVPFSFPPRALFYSLYSITDVAIVVVIAVAVACSTVAAGAEEEEGNKRGGFVEKEE